MRTILLTIGILLSQLAFSQGIKVVGNEPVAIPGSDGSYSPRLSPNGDYLLVTSANMQGLQKYDLATKKLSTITTEKSAGFGAQITSDGNTIVYRTSEYIGKLRYSSLKSLDITTGKETTLIKNTRNLQGVSVKEGTVLAVDNGKLAKKKVFGKTLSATPAVASIKDGQLYVTQNNVTKAVSPAGKDASYLWASVSPDGKKLLYYVINTAQAYVSHLDGSNAVSLGVLRTPSWMGNDWVIGMLDADNGEVITSSKIIAVAANGKGRTQLTDDSVIALNPSASLDATKVVYNTADGKIFLMTIETSK
ncbi:hypothetical protein FACS1894182_07760 [Bacteroidia bacterium]|nr:hypothetical protein FACS1894182_07760 [Bacteroidia bacterium]